MSESIGAFLQKYTYTDYVIYLGDQANERAKRTV